MYFVLFMIIPVSFSSNVQVIFSDYLLSVSRLSVRMFVNFSHFDFSRTTGPNFNNAKGKELSIVQIQDKSLFKMI